MRTPAGQILPRSFLFILSLALFAAFGAALRAPLAASASPVPERSDSGAIHLAQGSPAERIVVDQLGRSVRVPVPVRRIVLLPMPMPTVIYAIDGGGERIVGMHPTAMSAFRESVLREFSPGLEERAATSFVQQGFTVNLEELLKLRPDVVIQWDHQRPEIEKLERAGIPVVAIRVGTQEDLQEWFRITGELLGREDRAQALIAYHQEEGAAVRARTENIPPDERPRVLYLYNEQLRTIGTGHYYDEWMNAAGAVNVAAHYSGWINVTMEEVLSWNPDVIVISNFTDLMPEDIYADNIKGQHWSAINAVKNRRVYKIPLVGYRWGPPNPESPLMMWWFGKVLHPDRFADIDVVEKTRDFYRRFYEVDLSPEDVARRLRHVP